MSVKKQTILFVVDEKNWAFHHMVIALEEYIKDNFDCFICFANDYFMYSSNDASSIIRIKHNLKEVLKLIVARITSKSFVPKFIDKSLNFSLPYYFKKQIFSLGDKKSIPKLFTFIIEMDYYYQYTSLIPFKSRKRIVGIYTETFPHGGINYDKVRDVDISKLSRKEFVDEYIRKYDALIVGSQNLYEIYSNFIENVCIVNAINKQNNFNSPVKGNFENILTIGWTGNPNKEYKGFYSIILPVIEKIQSTGRQIHLKTKFSGPYEELFEFYYNVDVVVIASEGDTGPSLFAEASLSNVPSISTKVGFPAMVIKHNINGIIINRTFEDLYHAIIKVYDDRSLLHSFSTRIRNDYLKVLDNSIMALNLKHLLRCI